MDSRLVQWMTRRALAAEEVGFRRSTVAAVPWVVAIGSAVAVAVDGRVEIVGGRQTLDWEEGFRKWMSRRMRKKEFAVGAGRIDGFGNCCRRAAAEEAEAPPD